MKLMTRQKHTAAEEEGRLDLTPELGDVVADRDAPCDKKWKELLKSAALTVLVFIPVAVIVSYFIRGFKSVVVVKEEPCELSCSATLVESIPEGMSYGNDSVQNTIFDSWVRLIDSAEKSIDIASFYWSLRGADVVPHPSAWQGERIFELVKKAGLERGINIRVVQNLPSASAPDDDTRELRDLGALTLRTMNFGRLIGTGILHTKLWVVDGKHFFLGSANMDWRSLTQVKELGTVVYDCPCLARDVAKIFSVYWDLGTEEATIPSQWPDEYATAFNHTNPMPLNVNNTPSFAYFASSPPQMSPNGRSNDLSAILETMSQAREYINIAVMDYIPALLYSPHHLFWPDIDNHIRHLAIDKGIKVRLLVSEWKHSPPAMKAFLRSLADISNVYPHVDVQVKIFIVPIVSPDQERIPFGRVNHNKYMVTDKAAYIGTSNWSGDYFISTGGIGLVVNSSHIANGPTLQSQLKAVFDRDWNSDYALPLLGSHKN